MPVPTLAPSVYVHRNSNMKIIGYLKTQLKKLRPSKSRAYEPGPYETDEGKLLPPTNLPPKPMIPSDLIAEAWVLRYVSPPKTSP